MNPILATENLSKSFFPQAYNCKSKIFYTKMEIIIILGFVVVRSCQMQRGLNSVCDYSHSGNKSPTNQNQINVFRSVGKSTKTRGTTSHFFLFLIESDFQKEFIQPLMTLDWKSPISQPLLGVHSSFQLVDI